MGLLVLLLFAVLLLATTGSTEAYSAPDEPPASVRYFRVLDLLFPRELVDAQPSFFELALRYKPAFEAESQIVISRRRGFEELAVTYYSLPRASQRISLQIERIVDKDGIEDPMAIAKQIKVCARSVQVPSRVMADIMRKFANTRVPPDLGLDTRAAYLDYTNYQLWYKTVVTPAEVYISTFDADYGHDQNAQPLVRWMNEIKRTVEKYSPTE